MMASTHCDRHRLIGWSWIILGTLLGLFGGADQGIPPEAVAQLDRNLDTAGVEHEIVTYPGAPHSFFDRKFAEYAQESADAWYEITFDFVPP